jgi:hypothetical protein
MHLSRRYLARPTAGRDVFDLGDPTRCGQQPGAAFVELLDIRGDPLIVGGACIPSSCNAASLLDPDSALGHWLGAVSPPLAAVAQALGPGAAAARVIDTDGSAPDLDLSATQLLVVIVSTVIACIFAVAAALSVTSWVRSWAVWGIRVRLPQRHTAEREDEVFDPRVHAAQTVGREASLSDVLRLPLQRVLSGACAATRAISVHRELSLERLRGAVGSPLLWDAGAARLNRGIAVGTALTSLAVPPVEDPSELDEVTVAQHGSQLGSNAAAEGKSRPQPGHDRAAHGGAVVTDTGGRLSSGNSCARSTATGSSLLLGDNLRQLLLRLDCPTGRQLSAASADADVSAASSVLQIGTALLQLLLLISLAVASSLLPGVYVGTTSAAGAAAVMPAWARGLLGGAATHGPSMLLLLTSASTALGLLRSADLFLVRQAGWRARLRIEAAGLLRQWLTTVWFPLLAAAALVTSVEALTSGRGPFAPSTVEAAAAARWWWSGAVLAGNVVPAASSAGAMEVLSAFVSAQAQFTAAVV